MSSPYRKPDTCRQRRASLNGGMTYGKPARTASRPIRIRWIRVAGLFVVIAAIAAVGYQSLASTSSTVALTGTAWPARGQAAVQIGQSQVRAGPNQHPAPIASVAKVMTAYVVLRDHPLRR